MKKLLVVICLSLLFSGISVLFWYSEWKFRLPVPVASGYKIFNNRIYSQLPREFERNRHQAGFLHFFNAGCRCAKFSMIPISSLAQKYREKLSFAIVVMNNTRYSVKEIQDRLGIDETQHLALNAPLNRVHFVSIEPHALIAYGCPITGTYQ